MQIKDFLPWARSESATETKGETDHPVAALQRQMDRAFENFWGRLDRPFDLPWGEGTPRSDVVETDDAVEVSIELPGMDEKDIEVSLAGDMLTIKGEKKIERKDEKRGYYISERSYGAVYRAIPLPPGADAEKAEATFKNGVLTVRLPQTAESKAKVKKVDVKAA